MSKARVVYFDTETTGTKPERDEIIEIAGYVPDTDESFCEFVNPGIAIPQEITTITGITNDMVKDAQSFSIVGKAFADFCGPNAILIAHNNDNFDKHFIKHSFNRHKVELPEWRYLDTLKWARKYRPDLPRHALQFLREVYGVPANSAHRALDDVIVLHKVFSQMIDDLDMETVFSLLSQPAVLARMPFGKHQGKPLSQVPKDYIQWLAKSGAFDKPENEELKKSFELIGTLG